MPKFMFIYHADRDMRPAPGEEEAAMAAWGRWMEEVGPAMVNPGDPVGKSKSVSKDGIADDVPNAAFGSNSSSTVPSSTRTSKAPLTWSMNSGITHRAMTPRPS